MTFCRLPRRCSRRFCRASLCGDERLRSRLPAQTGRWRDGGVLGTAGSVESYRIQRVCLDADQAYGFAAAYNGIALVEPVQATNGMK